MTTGSTAPSTYTKKIEEQRFEFVLYINNHIICQRYFNVKDYNPESIKSLEMKELIDRIAGLNIDGFGKHGIIPTFLKDKSVEYLWENYNPYQVQVEDNTKTQTGKIDNFQFEIKVDKRVVARTEFSGNIFPTHVRYKVDIAEKFIPISISGENINRVKSKVLEIIKKHDSDSRAEYNDLSGGVECTIKSSKYVDNVYVNVFDSIKNDINALNENLTIKNKAKKLIPSIIGEINYFLSQKNYTVEY